MIFILNDMDCNKYARLYKQCHVQFSPKLLYNFKQQDSFITKGKFVDYHLGYVLRELGHRQSQIICWIVYNITL